MATGNWQKQAEQYILHSPLLKKFIYYFFLRERDSTCKQREGERERESENFQQTFRRAQSPVQSSISQTQDCDWVEIKN